VIDDHKPLMTKAQYLAFQEGVFKPEVYDGELGTSKVSE
jgi:hypothetical protein